jgi:hypothetical protein
MRGINEIAKLTTPLVLGSIMSSKPNQAFALQLRLPYTLILFQQFIVKSLNCDRFT